MEKRSDRLQRGRLARVRARKRRPVRKGVLAIAGNTPRAWIVESFKSIGDGMASLMRELEALEKPLTEDKVKRISDLHKRVSDSLSRVHESHMKKKLVGAFERASLPAFSEGWHNINTGLRTVWDVISKARKGNEDLALERRDSAIKKLGKDLRSTRAYEKIYSGRNVVESCGLEGILEPTPYAKHATMELEVDTVRADPEKLFFSLYNLVTNAYKSCKLLQANPLTIRITSRKEGNTVRIDVTDNGLGFGMDDLPKFLAGGESGFQKMGRGGSGSGLILVKRAVEQMGGRLEAHSDGIGEGATFSIILPA